MRNPLLLLLILFFSHCVKVGDRKFLHFFPIFISSEEISIRYPQASYTLKFGTPTEIKPILKGTVSSCSASENLPLGLNLSNQCVIYGTPIQVINQKTYTITARHFFQAKDTQITLTVAQPISISYPNSPYILGLGGSYTIAPNVTGTIQSCSISPPLPSGLSLQNDCSIVGVPSSLSSATTYTVTASNPTSNASTTLSIEVKNLPAVSFSSAGGSGLESIGTISIPVSLSFTEDATINYTVSGTATEGSDYTISGSLIFTNGGPTTQNLTLNVIDDTLYENDEIVIITLNIVSGAIAGTHMTYTYTIQNNDSPPQVSFNASTSSIVENGVTANIQIVLSEVSGLDVNVPVSINASSTATNISDYSLGSTTITIPAGSTTANLVVNIVDDSTDENDETVVINLGTPTNATLGAITTHTLTILDNDPPPTVEFASASSSGLESVTSVNFTVVLSAASEKTVTVNYATSDGTATAGMDYTATSGILTFPPGVTSQIITVNVTNGAMYEPDETFHITLSSPTNAGLGTNVSHTYTILNEDSPPSVQFFVASQSVNENVGTVTVAITQSAESGFNTTVGFSIHGSSTATGGGTDYSFTPASPVTINAGTTSTNITFTINNDTLYENDETIVINLTSAVNASLGSPTTHTITILNDDPMPQVSFTSGASVSFSEAVGTYGLGFSLDTASGLPVQVTINTADGTATAGSDYTAVTSQVVTIPAGVTSFTYPITIVNDLLTEGNETFTITMSSPVNATITGSATQTATILDNEIGITSATTLDCNGNGKIDHYRLQFASAITDSSFPGYIANSLGSVTSDWIVAGYSNVRLHHGTSFSCGSLLDNANDDTIYLQFDEGSSFDTGAKPDLTTSSDPLAVGPAGTVGIIFTATVTEADGARPVVVSITPNDGASGVLPNSYVQVSFSEDMNTATFNTTNFTVTGSMSVTGTVSTIDTKTPRFTPTTVLEYNQSHTVSITGMQDLAGNTNVSFTSGFTTAPKNRVLGNISGLGSLTMTLGVSVNGGSPISIPSTTSDYASGYVLANGDTYELTILTQPQGKVCAILNESPPAAGTFTGYSDLNIHVNCVDGYLMGNRVQNMAPEPLDFHLYQAKYETYYGSTTGYADGASPKFNSNRGIVIAKDYGYIADSGNSRIRRIDSSGVVTTIAGDGTVGNLDSPTGTSAKFNSPHGLASDGTYLYVSDTGNHNIRRIRLSGSYEVTTIAGSGTAGSMDGIGTAATFDQPRALALDENHLYVADFNNNKIRKIKLATKQVSTLTTITGAKPRDLTLIGNDIYVVCDDYKIRKVDKTSGTTTVFAGIDATSGAHDGYNPNFDYPISIMSDGTHLFVFDKNTARIRKIRISDKYTSTIAGSEYDGTDSLGIGINSKFTSAYSLTSDGRYIYASVSDKIAKVTNNGLMAYFPLRKNLDDYAMSRSLAYMSSPSYSTNSRYGVVNEALTLDGINHLFLSDMTGIPTGSSPRTLCAWVLPDDVATVGEKPILYYGTSGSYSQVGLALNSNGTYFTRIILDLGLGASNPSANISFPANQWFHICMVYTGSSGGNIAGVYYNGKLLDGGLTSAWNTGTGAFRIGTDLTNSKYFKGSIADVRIYNRALNPSEVAEIASQAAETQVGNSYSKEAIGLLSRYNFRGGSLVDIGPLGRNLTLFGTTSTIGTDGEPNNAYYFNGSSLLYVNGSLGLPAGSAPRTLCAWVNVERQPISGQIFTIISYGGDTSSGNYGSELIYYGSGGAYFLALSKKDDTPSELRKANYELPLYTWTHICGRYDGSTVRIYINGNYVSTDSSSVTFETQATSTNNFAIGAPGSVTAHYFFGKIDEVQIFNHALNDVSIRNMAAQIPRGLVARYDFNGDAQDSSGYGNHLSQTGGPSLFRDRFGNNNSSYNFNGTSQYFHVTSTPLPYSLGGAANTLCAWARPNFSSGDRFAVSYGTGSEQVYVGGRDFNTNNSVMKGGRDLDNWNASGLFSRFTWNHICSVYALGSATLYLNGRQVMTGVTGVWNINPTVLNIGRSTSGNRFFDGQIDDVMIYNRALTIEEIRALSGYHYMQVSSWSPNAASSSLKAAYRAERKSVHNNGDNLINELFDLSGNNFDLSLNGNVKYYTNEFGSLGGLDLSAGYLRNTNVSFDTGNFTIFSVQKLANSDSAQRPVLSLQKLLLEVQIRTSGNPDYKIRYCETMCAAETPPNSLNIGFIVTMQRNSLGTSSYTNGGYLNTGASLGLVTTPLTLTLGATNSGTNNFVGRIGEVFIFNGQLDEPSPYSGFTNRELMECFLAQKNQIVLNHSCP